MARIFAFCGQTMILAAVYRLAGAVADAAGDGGARHRRGARLCRPDQPHPVAPVFAPLADRSPNTIVAATLGVLIALTELSRIAADTHDYWLPPMLATPVVFASDRRLRGDADRDPADQLRHAVVGVVALAGTALSRALELRQALARGLRRSAGGGAVRRRHARASFTARCWSAGSAPRSPACWPALYYGNIGFGAGLVYGLKILFVTAVGGYLLAGAGSARGRCLRPGRIAVGRLFPDRMARCLDVRACSSPCWC